MKTLLKIKDDKGLFLWLDGKVAKLVVGYIPETYKAGQVFDDSIDAWSRGTYIHYWDYSNDTLEEALKVLEDK